MTLHVLENRKNVCKSNSELRAETTKSDTAYSVINLFG